MTIKEKFKKTVEEHNRLIEQLQLPVVYKKKGEHEARLWQVARWLAQGNGLAIDDLGPEWQSRQMTDISFMIGTTFDFCGALFIRRWDDYSWHEPTLEYIGLK